MATIKSFTDLEQSKVLANILPLDTADGCWRGTTNPLAANTTFWLYTKYIKGKGIPAWSLAALLSVLPVIIGDVLSKNALRLRMDKNETEFTIWYENLDSGMVEEGIDIIKSNPVDACVAMIEHLHELNLL